MALDEETRREIAEAVRAASGAPGGTGPVTGRTPSDAVAEVTGSVFTLLGQWTKPILLLVLIGFGWYYMQQQNSRIDQQYRDELSKLRQERDNAFGRLSEFTGQVSEISEKQIANLNLAFEKFREINEEARVQQQQVFENKAQIEQAMADLEDVEDQLDRARQANVQSRGQLEKARADMEKREAEVARKEKDLARRGGQIGELQDLIRQLHLASRDYVFELENALDQQAAEPQDPESSEPYIDPSWIPSPASEEFHRVIQLVLDKTTDPAAILAPILDFSGRSLDSSAVEALVGMSEARFTEFLEEHDGVGFDFWAYIDSAGEGYIVGIVFSGAARMRMALFGVSDFGDGDVRIVGAEAHELLLPLIGPSPEDAWHSAVYVPVLTYGAGDDFEEFAWAGSADAAEVPLSVIFEGDDITSTRMLHGGTALLPVLTKAAFESFLNDPGLPNSLYRELVSDDGVRPLLYMKEQLATGAPAWRSALDTLGSDARAAVTPLLEAAIGGALDPALRGTRPEFNLSEHRLGALAAMMLLPAFEIRVTSSARAEDGRAALTSPVQAAAVQAENAPPAEVQDRLTVQFGALQLNGPVMELQFIRNPPEMRWRVEDTAAQAYIPRIPLP
ncbi:hypothetical protein [Mangrovicoccus sp. HB161399]|uniref:hypothetical protein n=1 Tax=Mangrovicoccus sp. HB161399 TaxID=2720392 RepID=UPI001553A4D8|nr:hypothetical protein [Mangrovicoccus sp. HB161399]